MVVRDRLPPFVAGRRSVTATGLSRRIAFANTSDAEIFTSLGRGYAQAARGRGLGYVTGNAQGGDMRNVTQMNNFLSAGIGGMLVQPLNKVAQRPVMLDALRRGVQVQGIITDPCTLQVATAHYETGLRMGTAAADYIRSALGGHAAVCNVNQDSLSVGLQQRHRGILDGLRTGGPGVHITAEIPAPGNSTVEAGYAAMLSLAQQHPDVQVVLGPDTVVVGAYRALQSLGRLHEALYFAGTDGHADALELVRAGTPYRASYAFPWQLMGYALGNFAADWIDGLETPRALVVINQPLTNAADVDAFKQVNSDPADTVRDPIESARYFTLLGNVGYADRASFWEGSYQT